MEGDTGAVLWSGAGHAGQLPQYPARFPNPCGHPCQSKLSVCVWVFVCMWVFDLSLSFLPSSPLSLLFLPTFFLSFPFFSSPLPFQGICLSWQLGAAWKLSCG